MDYPEITRESGATVAFKISLIDTMVETGDPELLIEKVQQERENADNMDKIGREKRGWPAK
jgi:hypothetical protein